MSLMARPIPTGRLFSTTAAFPNCLMGRLPRTTFRGLQRSHDIIRRGGLARHTAKRRVFLEGFGGFVTSTAAPIATGWSDPLPGRIYTY